MQFQIYISYYLILPTKQNICDNITTIKKFIFDQNDETILVLQRLKFQYIPPSALIKGT